MTPQRLPFQNFQSKIMDSCDSACAPLSREVKADLNLTTSSCTNVSVSNEVVEFFLNFLIVWIQYELKWLHYSIWTNYND